MAVRLARALLVPAAAGAIARSLINSQRAELSLDPSHLSICELALRSDCSPAEATGDADAADASCSTPSRVRGFTRRGRSLLGGRRMGRPAGLEGQFGPEEADANPMVNVEVVAPGYFATLGVPVLRGGNFTDQTRIAENPPPRRHRQLSPLPNTTGRRAIPSGSGWHWGRRRPGGHRCSGVVPDTRYRDLREARPSIYFPLDQSFFPFAPTSLAIRTDGRSAGPVAAIRRAIGADCPGRGLGQRRTVRGVPGGTAGAAAESTRFSSWLIRSRRPR